MRGLTTVVIRHRWLILLCWLVLFVLGGLGAAKLGPLLSNRFSVPGSDAEKGLNIVRAKFHERSDGAFTLVVQSHGAPVDRATVQAAAERGASVLDQGRAGPVLSAGQGVLYAQINSALENAKASDRTPAVRAAVGHIPGATVYVTGFPALNHDEQPLYSSDLTRGESIAIPIALIVLLYMFATVGATLVPIVFALITIPTTLGGVWIVAHFMSMATYVTNIVSLIGIAIAIDYSMLVVFRFREELAHGKEPDDALITTMMTAGRATLFSGSTVAVGLALLAFMPLPFIRSMGIGGLLVPLVSMAASATLLPTLLSLLGHRVNALRIVPRRVLERRAAADRGMWTRLAHFIMRRPVAVLVLSSVVLLAIAAPALQLRLTGGDNRGTPTGTNATDGLFVLERTLGAGALAPHQIIIDTGRPGGALAPAVARAELRLGALLRADHDIDSASVLVPAALSPERARAAGLLDPTNQVAQVRAAGYSGGGVHRSPGPPHRRAGVRRGLPRQGLRRLPLAGARGARDHLPTPAAGVPIDRAAGQGRVHEPALGDRDLRSARLALPARLGKHAARAQDVPADRGLDPDLPVRGPVRALDGLRGLPALAHARGVGSHARQQPQRGLRPRAHGPHHHRGGGDHDRRLLRVRRRSVRRIAGVRRRALGGHPARRHARARAARARDDDPARALELVPARAGAARDAPRAGHPVVTLATRGKKRL
jgi:hypothetical protein